MGIRSNDIIIGKIKRPADPVEDALKDSELRYRRLFETAQDGILIIDAETGHINDVNPFLMNLLGYSRKDFIDKALWHFGPFKDIRASKAAFKDLIKSGYIRYAHLPLETKDGRHIEVEFISNVYQAGQKRTIQCNIRDNSQHKKTEAIRLKFETQLKQAQKMEAVATLAGGVAHQFNNALTVITNGLSLLGKECHQKNSRYIQHMTEAAGKMARLTRQLLAYARDGNYGSDTILLSDLVADSLPLFKPSKPSITIETEFSKDLPPIKADRDQMQIVLLAVLANASEAIETQGLIRVTCRKEVLTDEAAKAFSGLAPGIYACLTVEDNGKGMKEETRNRVFEPFFTTHFTGRGLGMAAVYGIVKNHEGWISVESQLDVGTTVTVRFPAFLKVAERIAEKREFKQNRANGARWMTENDSPLPLCKRSLRNRQAP